MAPATPTLRKAQSEPRLVAVVAFPGLQLLDVAGPVQTFATTNETAGTRHGAPYRVVVVSRRGGAVTTSSGLPIVTRAMATVRHLCIDTLVVPGGPGVHAALRDANILDWVRREGAAARRVASVCTGAFLLAEAGMLAGRRATTHWKSCDRLQRAYPAIRVEPDPIYIRDGRVWTSAGITAGIDLTLALVQEDLGRQVAMQVARHLVMFLNRPGGQSQFSVALQAQSADSGATGADRFAPLHDFIAGHLAGDLRVERLAEQAGMSPRNFARIYAAQVGMTPARMVEKLRVEAVRRLLEETATPIKRIAAQCGFAQEERLRRAFARQLGTTPADYRKRF